MMRSACVLPVLILAEDTGPYLVSFVSSFSPQTVSFSEHVTFYFYLELCAFLGVWLRVGGVCTGVQVSAEA